MENLEVLKLAGFLRTPTWRNPQKYMFKKTLGKTARIPSA